MNPSHLLAGRYRLIEPLGEGRIGTVWLAHDRKAGVDVAIKIPHAWQGRNPEFVARFRRELLTGMRLHHPSIVRSLDTGQHDGMPFLVMELVQGAPIHIWFESSRRDFDALAELLTQLLDALGYAHGHRLVHQDLKPANVLVDEKGRVHITDFGLAGRLEDQTRVSETGEMLVDLAYLSPEQAMGERGDVRSDLYSLGAVLYHVLTGRAPVEARDPAQFLLAILNQAPHPPHRVRQDIPSWLARLTMRMMARQPDERPASATEVQRLLQRQSMRKAEPLPAGKRRSLLGRDEPLAELRGLLTEVKGGRGLTVRITGTAGIGKTSLVEEFLRRSRPVASVKVQASGLQPLHPGLLEKALGGSGTLLERLSARLAQGPLILVVEGAHEATPELVEALRSLAVPERALMQILTDRPGKVRHEGITAWLNESPHRILLRGFSREICTRYVEETVWATPPDAAVGWLMKMTHGNPLHLGMLLRQLEGTNLQISGVVATWEEPRDIPRTLPDLISWIIERQGPDATAVISMAACLEERFELGLLQSVVTYEERVLEDTLDGLVRAGLLEELWENGVQQYAFAHEPIWRVALHRVPERRQRRFCLLTGNLTAGVDPERAARFFVRAHRPAQAVEQFMLLANHELGEGFFETAAFMAGRAEALAAEEGLAREQTAALMLRARALALAEHYTLAREAASRVLKQTPTPEQATEARTLLRRTPIDPKRKPTPAAKKKPVATRPPAQGELAPELALSPAAKRAVLGARKKGVAPPPAPKKGVAPPARAVKPPSRGVAPPPKKTVEPKSKTVSPAREAASVAPPARKSQSVAPPARGPARPAKTGAQPSAEPNWATTGTSTTPTASAGEAAGSRARPEPLFGIKPPSQGVRLQDEEYPGLLGLVKPPKPPRGAPSSEETRLGPGPQGKVGPAGRVRPPRSPYLSGAVSERPGPPRLPSSWAPAPSPVSQEHDSDEPLAPARLAGPVSAEVTPPRPGGPTVEPSVELGPPSVELPNPDRAQPLATEVSQEPPAPPPDLTPEFVEPPETAARRRYETARAAGDRAAAASAADELARIYEGKRERQKATLWRHQARILNS